MSLKKYLCISIAERPSMTGFRFHNRGYKKLDLPFIYVPMKVESKDFEDIIKFVRENCRGCSVSMPYKVEAIKYLDEIDEVASKIGAVNTIVNTKGLLKGYNTDYYGAKRVIEETLDIQGKNVLMIGAGGVAKAVGYAIRDLAGKLVVTNRTEKKARDLAYKLNAEVIPWKLRDNYVGNLLINATSIGMLNNNEMPISPESLENFDAIMDVIVSPTRLINESELRGKLTIKGKTMTIYQAAKQFEIYTGKKLPEEFLITFLEEE